MVAPAARAAGFTLIELLVILAILALVSGIVFPSVATALRRQGFASAVAQLDLGLRAARADAIRQGRAIRFDAASDGQGFRFAETVERFEASSRITVPDHGLQFFADGSAIGGGVALTDGRETRRWTVRSATGAIEPAR